MHTYYFAGCRLLTDDGVARHPSAKRLANFTAPMPYTHSFTLRLSEGREAEEKRSWALSRPTVLETEFFTIHDTGEGWAFVSTPAEGTHHAVLCSRDYADVTVAMADAPGGQKVQQALPFSNAIRVACEAGMASRSGLPLHASLVEKDGFGVVFLGPSGMGKSTQAKLWERYLGADVLSGDRPCLRKLDGQWRGFGMPWDGKDAIFRQGSVPVQALVWLEQAKENRVAPMSPAQAAAVLLKQTVLPMWDDAAMDDAAAQLGTLARELPFYHLRCLPDEAAARLTFEALRGEH